MAQWLFVAERVGDPQSIQCLPEPLGPRDVIRVGVCVLQSSGYVPKK